jgi:hypothetical protein
MKYPTVLVSWVAVLQGLAYYACSKHQIQGAHAVVAFCMMLWAGLLVAISFTEAWVKFRSKVLERYVALDVGRRVFDALNTLELAACSTMITTLYRYEQPQSPIWTIPSILAGILMFQMVYLTPKLELRAFFVGVEELAKKKNATRADEALYKELKAITTLETMPSIKLHHLYVFLELAKLVLCFKGAEVALFGAS